MLIRAKITENNKEHLEDFLYQIMNIKMIEEYVLEEGIRVHFLDIDGSARSARE